MYDIEYKLRLFLNSTTLSLDNAKYKDPTGMELLLFLKKYKNQKMIHAFLPIDERDHTVTPFFGVPIDESKIKHKVVYCQIAVGTPLFASEEYAMNCKAPAGYDSFIISKSGTGIENVISEIKKTGVFSTYSYVIPDKSRVIVLAEVEFTYDKALEDRCKNNNVCESCGNGQAVSFCLAERASFCEVCDKSFHANSFTQRHERYYFNKVGKKRFIHCTAHTSTVVDFFCNTCKVPICTQCRIFGSHSEHPNSKHELITYIEACDRLKLQVSEESELMQGGLTKAKKSMGKIEYEICAFEKNIAEVRERIEQEYRDAMCALKELVKKRYQHINSRYFESKYLEIAVQRAVGYPKEVDPSVLVEKWRSIEDFNRYINEMNVSAEEEGSSIKVKGALSVEFEEQSQQASPEIVTLQVEEELTRQKTEMLLRVSKFR